MGTFAQSTGLLHIVEGPFIPDDTVPGVLE
jgi:hypothetical protein